MTKYVQIIFTTLNNEGSSKLYTEKVIDVWKVDDKQREELLKEIEQLAAKYNKQ